MSDINYELIGRQAVASVVAQDLMGDGGFDTNFLFNALSETGKRATTEIQNKQAADKARADDAAALGRAKNADAAWADGEAMLIIAQPNQKAAAQAIRDGARSAALAIKLQGDSQNQRVANAQTNESNAAKAAYAAPNDALANAKSQAWQIVATGVAANVAPAVAPSAPTGSSPSHSGGVRAEEPSFLQRKYAGVPVWGWGLGGAAALGGVVLLVRSLKRRR